MDIDKKLEESLSSYHYIGTELDAPCKSLWGDNSFDDCDCGLQEQIPNIKQIFLDAGHMMSDERHNKNVDEELYHLLIGVWHYGYNVCNVEKNHPDGYDNYDYEIQPKKAKKQIKQAFIDAGWTPPKYNTRSEPRKPGDDMWKKDK